MTGRDPILDAALRGARVTETVELTRGALSALADVHTRHFPSKTAIVVADQNTFEAAGKAAHHALRDAGIDVEDPYIFEAASRLKADSSYARQLADYLRQRDCIAIGVGSGVINDLTKYASGLLNRQYICVPTAASMDGYSASGASLLDDGFKRTMPCPPPVAIVADLDVIAQAPKQMAGWGYGDLGGKIVAGLDWRIASALGEDVINPGAFALVQDNLTNWLSEPAAIAEGDIAAMRNLMSGLLISGFAIQAHGDSRPASGSEHQFAHLWEMEGLTVNGHPASHGACVGVASVGMLALYDVIMNFTSADFEAGATERAQMSEAELRTRLESLFTTPKVLESAWNEAKIKHLPAVQIKERAEKLASVWPDLVVELEAAHVSPSDFVRNLRAVGAPAHPEEFGISLTQYATDYERAQYIRRRYTSLDLLNDTGTYQRAVTALFSPDGFWPRTPFDVGSAA